MSTNPDYINRHQPVRNRIDPETGEILQFRTRPKKQRKMINLHTRSTQVCQASLYRAVRRGEVPNQVGIADLHQWIAVGDLFSKTHLGFAVVNALVYEPRIMVNNFKVGKATMSYAIRNMKELEYGLEWMICIWLRKFLNHLGENPEGPTDMQHELDELAAATTEEFKQIYINELFEWNCPYFDWNDIAEKQGFDFEENMPRDEGRSFITKSRPKSLV